MQSMIQKMVLQKNPEYAKYMNLNQPKPVQASAAVQNNAMQDMVKQMLLQKNPEYANLMKPQPDQESLHFCRLLFSYLLL